MTLRQGADGQRAREVAVGGHGRAVQVDPIKPTLKASGTKRLTLKCDEPLSNVAFKFDLRRYITDVFIAIGSMVNFDIFGMVSPQCSVAGAYTRSLLSST